LRICLCVVGLDVMYWLVHCCCCCVHLLLSVSTTGRCWIELLARSWVHFSRGGLYSSWRRFNDMPRS